MKTLKDFDVNNKKVLVRCDFNVPLSEKGNILDDFRIKKTLPTISYLKEKGAKIILMSHLGRPNEVENERLRKEKFSLKPVALRLGELLNEKVKFLPDCIEREVEKEIDKMEAGKIILLENLRFYKGEEENSLKFAEKLAKLGDIYINDAFGACHRAHASIVGIPKYIVSGAGFLLEKEIEVLTKLMKSPQKPLIAIIGGTKVETKTEVIDKISKVADLVLIGGLIKREIEEKRIKLTNPKKIMSPPDRIAEFDIGPKAIQIFREKIKTAKTVFWSGPLGKIEEEEFQTGSKEVAKAIIESGAFSVVGGGDTVGFLNKIGLAKHFNHVSTGGGAMLSFLSGERLPGIEALKK